MNSLRWALVVLLSASIAAGAWWALNRSSGTSPAPAALEEAPSIPGGLVDHTAAITDEETAPQAGNAEPNRAPPPRVVHPVAGESKGESTESPFDYENISAADLAPSSLSAVAAALDGDLVAVDFLMSAVQGCRGVPSNEEGARSLATEFEKHYHRFAYPGPRRVMMFELMPTAQENLVGIHRTMEACANFRQLWSDARVEIQRLAEQGHVAARLLFAMMPPQDSSRTRSLVPFEEQFDWEAAAREYSMANLMAGAPEGFLAYAYSYQHGLFTPPNQPMSLAFMKAAMDCGQVQLPTGSFASSLAMGWEKPETVHADEAYWLISGQAFVYYEAIIGHCR